jgi:Mce-associated membrane protein
VNTTGSRLVWWTFNAVLILGIAAATAVGLWLNGRDVPESRPAGPTVTMDHVQKHVQEVVPKLLSYTPASVATMADTVDPLLTGDFKAEYRELLEETIVPQAQQQRITNDTEVVGVAVESLGTDEASVLVFVDQQTTKRAEPEPQRSESAVQVGLRKVQEQWLISSFRPV